MMIFRIKRKSVFSKKRRSPFLLTTKEFLNKVQGTNLTL